GLALSTDVIVGFPGEDKDDFASTEALVRRVRYDAAFLFKHSPREGTRAWQWRDTVPEDEKGHRLQRLVALQESLSAEINRRLSYRSGGSGPVLVLIHGITASAATWDDVLPWLAERHTVVAPDLFGHGRSAKPRGDYSLGAYANGIRDLLEVLGIPRATIVGHSLGGGIAMQFAYQFPERCERLVLVSSGGLGR